MTRPFVQAIVLIVTAAVLAIVSNAVAGRDRRLVLPGYYPNALRVPTRTVAPSVPPTVNLQPSAIAPTQSSPAPATAIPPATVSSPSLPVTTTSASKLLPAPSTTTAAAAQRPPATDPPAPAAAPADLASRFPPHPDKAYVEVSGEDAVLLHDSGALMLDARRTSVFEAGHIAGARSFSVWESDIDDKVNKLYEERNDPREQLKPILIYCSGGDCEDSHMLAQKLWGVQFNNIYVYKDGFPDWQKRRGATHTGTNP